MGDGRRTSERWAPDASATGSRANLAIGGPELLPLGGGRNLAEAAGQSNGTAHRLLEVRIEDLGGQLPVHLRRLDEVGRALAEAAQDPRRI